MATLNEYKTTKLHEAYGHIEAVGNVLDTGLRGWSDLNPETLKIVSDGLSRALVLVEIARGERDGN